MKTLKESFQNLQDFVANELAEKDKKISDKDEEIFHLRQCLDVQKIELAKKNEEIGDKNKEIFHLRQMLDAQKDGNILKKEFPASIWQKIRYYFASQNHHNWKMDVVLLRFPHLGKQIFEILEEQPLVNCIQTSRVWEQFISKENSSHRLFQTLGRIQKYTGCSKANIGKILKQTDLETLVNDVNEVYNGGGLIFQAGEHLVYFSHGDLTPFHKAAAKGHLTVCKLILDNNPENKNPKCTILNNTNDVYGLTPLHLAAGNGHLMVCKLILAMADNKNPKSGCALNGMTALDMARYKGYSQIYMLISSTIAYQAISKIMVPLQGAFFTALSVGFGLCFSGLLEGN